MFDAQAKTLLNQRLSRIIHKHPAKYLTGMILVYTVLPN
jgi:hypothetical protein